MKYKEREIKGGEGYEPWYMRINPKGQVPVLRHGEKYIIDSSVIIEYLDEHFGNLLRSCLFATYKQYEIRPTLVHKFVWCNTLV